MGEGGRFGEGVWCSTDKTKWHRYDPHIVSDKDAAKRAAERAPPINPDFLTERERTCCGGQVFVYRARLPSVRRHRRDAVTVRHPRIAADGSLLQCKPDRG